MQPTELPQGARPVDVSLLLQMIGERDVTIAVLQGQLAEVSARLEQLTEEILALRGEADPEKNCP